MSWNESGNGKDPWGRGNEQPADLDKIAREWQQRLSRLFGGKRGSGGGGFGSTVFLVGLLAAAWFITGFYRVDEAERGVVQRFGAYTDTTMPGLHWHWPFPVERVDIVNADEVQTFPYKTDMLTADQKYVTIEMVVQYRRANVTDYLFKVFDPDATLRDVTESALREVVGTSELEQLVTGDREQIAQRTRAVLQDTIDDYGTGLILSSISVSRLDYPEQVQDAVDDAQRAQNDSNRFKLEAQRYANDIVPRARGEAARIVEDARAYQDRVTRDAEGQASRFTQLLAEYKKAPRVTRDRLYIEAVEDVYRRTSKVLLDAKGSGNLLYLPIDKILENQGSRSTRTGNPSDSLNDSRDQNSSTEARDTSRDRSRRQ